MPLVGWQSFLGSIMYLGLTDCATILLIIILVLTIIIIFAIIECRKNKKQQELKEEQQRNHKAVSVHILFSQGCELLSRVSDAQREQRERCEQRELI